MCACVVQEAVSRMSRTPSVPVFHITVQIKTGLHKAQFVVSLPFPLSVHDLSVDLQQTIKHLSEFYKHVRDAEEEIDTEIDEDEQKHFSQDRDLQEEA